MRSLPSWAALPLLAFAGALGGCKTPTRDNPAFCRGNEECKTPTEYCDARDGGSYTCLPVDGGVGGAGGRAGSGASAGGAAGTGGVAGASGVDGAVTGGMPGGAGATAAGGAGGVAGVAGSAGRSGGGGGGAVDAGQMPDVNMDVQPEVPVGCPMPCAGPKSFCDIPTRECVCRPSDCGDATPICSPTTRACAPCATDTECGGINPLLPYCAAGHCVACKVDANCRAPNPACFSGQCVPCTTAGHCLEPAKPICNAMHTCEACMTAPQCMARNAMTHGCVLGQCVECAADADCANAARPICNAMHMCEACTTGAQCSMRNSMTRGCVLGQCVECAADADCSVDATKPICVGSVCRACATDAQCVRKLGANPGVCMSHTDGHCARDAEAVYVNPMAGCDMPNATGTATTPFCTPQRAISAVTTARPLVVLRKGTVPLEGWTYGGPVVVTVVGQDGAAIGPGTGVGISITMGSVYLRDVQVTGMLDTGITASGTSTTIRMDRCMVTHNHGGLSVNSATYDIRNSVFADNDGTLLPVTFGGVYLNSPNGSTARFWNNTIYRNGAVGLSCAAAYPVRGLLVTDNTIAQVINCVTDGSSLISGIVPILPMFDPARPYHLTATSPCVDRGMTTDFSPLDLDGNPRPSPAGGMPDCGAHEFQK